MSSDTNIDEVTNLPRYVSRFFGCCILDNFCYAILNLCDAIILVGTLGFYSPANYIQIAQNWVQEFFLEFKGPEENSEDK